MNRRSFFRSIAGALATVPFLGCLPPIAATLAPPIGALGLVDTGSYVPGRAFYGRVPLSVHAMPSASGIGDLQWISAYEREMDGIVKDMRRTQETRPRPAQGR